MSDREPLPQTAPRPDRCGTCRFWSPHRTDRNVAEFEDAGSPGGECRRFPPVFLRPKPDYLGDMEGCWPETYSRHWCGEWHPVPPPDGPPAPPPEGRWQEFLSRVGRIPRHGAALLEGMRRNGVTSFAALYADPDGPWTWRHCGEKAAAALNALLAEWGLPPVS